MTYQFNSQQGVVATRDESRLNSRAHGAPQNAATQRTSPYIDTANMLHQSTTHAAPEHS